MLAQVVGTGGSGTRAHVRGYQVAGKTGTVRKLENERYSSNRYLSIFAGIAPLRQPRLAMVVMIDEPRTGDYYGGIVAAPVFAHVIEGALRVMGVPPDPITVPAATQVAG